MKPMAHQTKSLKFMASRPRVFDMSDPGTGKTYVEIMDFAQQHKKDGKAMMVFAPKSLLKAAWGNDVRKFAPHLKVSICWAKNRQEALNTPADVYVINVDGVTDLLKQPKTFWKKFGRLVIDESTAFKHRDSLRSKAMKKISEYFSISRLLSGTPMPNGVCDLWHQMLILDGGERLGKNFFAFRSACCFPEQTGPSAQHLKWVDKPGIEDAVVALISDITIRHVFEECVDIPANHKYALELELTDKHLKFYQKFEQTQLEAFEGTTITAINAAALNTKLLQVASGAVYNDQGGYTMLDTSRYEMIIDLVEERKHSVVFYLWDHQRDELVKAAKKRGISHTIWNPDTPQIEQEFQAGMYQVLFAHPQSAGHGLTFTKGTATIWSSPTYNLEHYLQGLKRIHRIGQKEKTETIVIVAKDTRDEHAWARMQDKKVRQDDFFTAIKVSA